MLNTNGVSTAAGEPTASMGFGYHFEPAEMQALMAGQTLTTFHAGTTFAYPLGSGLIYRTVRSLRMTVSATKVIDLYLELGDATPDPSLPPGATPEATATAHLWGAVTVGCGYLGGGDCTEELPDGSTVTHHGCYPVADPTYSSQFCQTEIDEYGIRSLIE